MLFLTKTIYPAIELIIIAAIRKSFCGMRRGTRCKMKIVDKAMHGLTYEHSRCLRPFYYNYYISIFPLLDFHHYTCSYKKGKIRWISRSIICKGFWNLPSLHLYILDVCYKLFQHVFSVYSHAIIFMLVVVVLVSYCYVCQFLFYFLLIHFLLKIINKHLSITCAH